MTFKTLLFWFGSTLALGAFFGILLGESLYEVVGQKEFAPPMKNVLSGSTFAAVSELGFFSYLVFNWLSNGLVRNRFFYQIMQVFLIIVVIANLIYLNITKFNGVDLYVHLLIPFFILFGAFVVAWFKVRATNGMAWVPTLFFMVVATTLEMIPSLNPKEGELGIPFILFTGLILFVCNAWQILQLHHWVKERNKKARQVVSSF